MPRTPPPASAPASDSDDAAPEVLTLAATKRASRTRAAAVRASAAAQRQKRKNENRAAGEAHAAAARMQRAMREAADEEAAEADEGAEDAEEWPGLAPATAAAPSKHLPAHLFAALAAPPRAAPPPATHAPRKTRRAKPTPKDIVVGSRTLRAVPRAAPVAALTRPPARVRRFLARTLKLKKPAPGAAWARRPVNVGAMRSGTGPALRFARGRDA